MKKAGFCTLGCKVNQYETEAMITLFKDRGYCIADFEDVCDVYVINTCTVTGTGDRKSRQIIRRAKKLNPDSFVIVAGCYSQVAPGDVLKIDGVNLVLGTKDRGNIVHLYEDNSKQEKESVVEDIMKCHSFENLSLSTFGTRTRAYIKIQEKVPNLSIVQGFIREVVSDTKPEPIKIEQIITEVARTYNVSEGDILSSRRTADLVKARQVAMYIARETTELPYQSIGEAFGKNHTTVLYTEKKVKELMRDNSYEKTVIEDIIKNLKSE
jgi:hypothetical protein